MNARVDVWRVSLRGGGDEEAEWMALLSPVERARALNYRRTEDWRHFVGCRAALRRLLGEATGMEPEGLRIEVTPEGKPYLRDARTPVFFNVSHSRDYALIALCRSMEVGVDIEWIDPGVDVLAVAARHFSPEDCARLNEVKDEAGRLGLFYRLWTVREAGLKARGYGCSRYVPTRQEELATDVIEMDAPPCYAASLAVFSLSAFLTKKRRGLEVFSNEIPSKSRH